MKQNQVILVGYVGQHLKKGNTLNGTKRVSIRLATHYKVQNEENSSKFRTVWHDVVVWGSVAKYAEQNFVKGSHILVEGSIVYKTYPDYTGHTRYITQIYAQSLMNLDR